MILDERDYNTLMEKISFTYTPPLKPTKKPNILLEQIRDLLGNRYKKVNGVYVDTGEKWSYKDLGIYLGGIPKEWLKGFYSASVDAKNPAKHFMWLVKQSRFKTIK